MSVATLSGYAPKRRYDNKPWIGASIEGAASDTGPWTTVESFEFSDPDGDPSEPAVRNFTTELVDSDTMKWLRVTFVDEDGDVDATDPLPLTTTGNLTTTGQIAVRLARDLSDREVEQCKLLINSVTMSILASLGRDPTSWTPPAKAKPFMSLLCTEVVCRSMRNPEALESRSERIGSYSYSETYAERGMPAPGPRLTDAEELTVRRVVFGSNIASVKVRSQADEYAELIWPQMEFEWALWYGPTTDSPYWK